MPRKISMVAFDIGPAKNLAMVITEALKRGERIQFAGNRDAGKISWMDCDVLLTGLSSFKNEEELKLGAEATNQGILWLVLADTHRAWGRDAAKGRVNEAIAIVASPAEIDLARRFGYKEAVYLGGPPLWRDYSSQVLAFDFDRFRRDENEKLILVGGIKDPGITNTMIEVVVKSMAQISIPWRLVLKLHPNEGKNEEENLRRQSILKGVVVLTPKDNIDDLLRNVDLSVHTSGATATISAAYQRLPVIYFENELVRQRMLKVTGVEYWFPAEIGACLLATEETMKTKIRELLFDDEMRYRLKRRQEETYPLPGGISPEKQILDYIQRTVTAKEK